MKKQIFLIGLMIITLVSLATMSIAAGNDVTGKIWKLDTVGLICSVPVDIEWILWQQVTTDTANMSLLNTSGGNIILELQILSWDVNHDNTPRIIYFEKGTSRFPGVYLNTLDSGYVYINTRRVGY